MAEHRLNERDPRFPSQPSLFGNQDALQTDRLFFAIFASEYVAERTLQIAQRVRSQQSLKGRPLAAARLHVSLFHIGDHSGLPQGIIGAAMTAAATVVVPSFDVAFDRAASFPRRLGRKCPFVLLGGDGLTALTSFQQVLGRAMTGAGLERFVHADYTPHMTLLYDNRCVPEEAVETIRWTVREFVLVHSLLGQTKHVRLGQWALPGNIA